MENRLKAQVQTQLSKLIGLKLSIARRAADLRGFHFGHMTVEEAGDKSYGEFALHIQCPWRLQDAGGIITGRADLWEPAEPSDPIDWDTWDYSKDPNLQDRRIGTLLQGYDPKTKSLVNLTEHLVVEKIDADEFGGATLFLSGGYGIVIFPSGSTGEDWRMFEPSKELPHFVVSGGKVEPAADDKPE